MLLPGCQEHVLATIDALCSIAGVWRTSHAGCSHLTGSHSTTHMRSDPAVGAGGNRLDARLSADGACSSQLCLTWQHVRQHADWLCLWTVARRRMKMSGDDRVGWT
jgi:hypothetical protein